MLVPVEQVASGFLLGPDCSGVQVSLTLSRADEERITSRTHPLGASLPDLDALPSFHVRGHFPKDIHTTCLGVTTEWVRRPDVHPDELLNLYSWSFSEALRLDGRVLVPGAVGYWHEPARVSRGGKPWAVTLVGVATEHVDRVLKLCPGLMVRRYNGTIAFALPAEVEL